MPAKKKTIEDVEETEVEVREINVKFTPSKSNVLIATSDFDYSPYPGAPMKTVLAGETFTPPEGWVRDLAYEEVLTAAKSKQGKAYEPGVVFTYQGEVVNPGEKNAALRERREHRAILPLKES